MHTPPGADGDDAERIGAGNRLGGAVRQRHAGERAETADRDSAWPRLSGGGDGGLVERSEEHTSELQSLMRISYAVFCLKKKKIIIMIQTHLEIRQSNHI